MYCLEVKCRATCTYCGKQEEFFVDATDLPQQTNDRPPVPPGWYTGRRYMSETRTIECSECSGKPHY